MRILLLGEEKSERTDFFMKAAADMKIAVEFTQIPTHGFAGIPACDSDFDSVALKDFAVKIDPPDPHSTCIDDLHAFGMRYTGFLEKLDSASGVTFLNAPKEIAHTLDKCCCKRLFAKAGIRAALDITSVYTVLELREALSSKRINGAFIKPRFGSGAAGVSAFRRNPRTGQEVLYTTACPKDGRLYNTRKQRRVSEPHEIETIVNSLLRTDALVEKWIPKAEANGKTYDIRIIWQFDQILYAIARFSGGVITNLHLGGSAAPLSVLGLNKETLYGIETLCRESVSLFPGLVCAGIDVLLERGTMKPYLIEINGQGDLLYRDIQCENKIYKSQIMYLNSL